ncbi:MAG: putative poly(beta-D-mannuronate) O-acetylase [Actinomycetia bacterium]|nr:putative poly(beta-D-mannuronate) O-acetylase [Actinomycetes bacterium]
MLFPTVTFAIFFAIVLPLNWLLMPQGRRWRVFIIAASYFFYGYWNWRFTALLAVVTVWNQFWGRAIHRASGDPPRRLALAIAIAGDLGVLAYFKYYDFFLLSTKNLLGDFGMHFNPTFLAITLPVGVSFFTFQSMSYVIDIYRKQLLPVRFLDFAVYVCFFPHLVAGPIVRASEFLPQLRERKDPRRIDASRAFFLIMAGLFKKMVLADFLSTHIVEPVFGVPAQHSALEALVGVYGFAVQIYCDFSGYTDIAIGLALLLGFRFPQNFDAPYTAVSIQDFWRRWHMTLSRWLRDYLYIPLGGNRGTTLQTYRNLMLTMLLGGLWHGARWTFVMWGGLHGAYLVYEHHRGERSRAGSLPFGAATPRSRFWQRVVTFHLVCLAWVFFRAETFNDALTLIGRLFSGWSHGSPLVTPAVLLAIAVGIGMQYIPRITIERAEEAFSRLKPAMMGLTLGVGLLCIDALGPVGVSNFIYFAF